MSDLKLAYDTLIKKQPSQTDYWRYYLGDQPVVYANERLQEVFRGVLVRFTENWCGVVIDSLKDRITLDGFSGPDSAQELLDELWMRNEMNLESDDIHEAALVTGEAYLVIWPDETGKVEMYYNDPRLCQVFYQADKPRIPRMAAKLWSGDDDLARITLYYPDRLEYYISSSKADSITSAAAFRPDESIYANGVAPNPYGVIPVFRFTTRRQGIGDLQDVVPIQNGINKLLTDMMVAAEYGAFKQRWVISNSDVDNLRNAPNEIWNVPAGDGMGQATSVGEFSATDLNNYLSSIEHLAGDISRITRLPKHYFYAQGGDPSGEALIAMEAPLTRKANQRIERFTSTWQKAMAFACQVAGVVIDPVEISPIYQPVETVQPRTQAEIRLLNVQAGIPLVTTLRREGWSEQELEEMNEDKQTNMETFGQNLLTAFEKGDQGNENVQYQEQSGE